MEKLSLPHFRTLHYCRANQVHLPLFCWVIRGLQLWFCGYGRSGRLKRGLNGMPAAWAGAGQGWERPGWIQFWLWIQVWHLAVQVLSPRKGTQALFSDIMQFMNLKLLSVNAKKVRMSRDELSALFWCFVGFFKLAYCYLSECNFMSGKAIKWSLKLAEGKGKCWHGEDNFRCTALNFHKSNPE